MMKNKAPIILIIPYVIFFNAFTITGSFKKTTKANIEMIVTAKLLAAIETPYWVVQRFYHHQPADLLQKISNFTNSFL